MRKWFVKWRGRGFMTASKSRTERQININKITINVQRIVCRVVAGIVHKCSCEACNLSKIEMNKRISFYFDSDPKSMKARNLCSRFRPQEKPPSPGAVRSNASQWAGGPIK